MVRYMPPTPSTREDSRDVGDTVLLSFWLHCYPRSDRGKDEVLKMKGHRVASTDK